MSLLALVVLDSLCEILFQSHNLWPIHVTRNKCRDRYTSGEYNEGSFTPESQISGRDRLSRRPIINRTINSLSNGVRQWARYSDRLSFREPFINPRLFVIHSVIHADVNALFIAHCRDKNRCREGWQCLFSGNSTPESTEFLSHVYICIEQLGLNFLKCLISRDKFLTFYENYFDGNEKVVFFFSTNLCQFQIFITFIYIIIIICMLFMLLALLSGLL